MGRKRWWKAGSGLLLLWFLPRLVLGDGEVGCLFSKNVCRNGLETCYDDWAFGRCVRDSNGEPEDGGETPHRYDLDAEELDSLRRELESLLLGGYTWVHPYTQCVIQASLHALRFRSRPEHRTCRKLANVEDSGFEEYSAGGGIGGIGGIGEADERTREPLAIVKFTPIRGHGYGEFANENYYPPSSVSSRNDDRDETRGKYPPEDYVYGASSSSSSFVGSGSSLDSILARANSLGTEPEGTLDDPDSEASNFPRILDENSVEFGESSSSSSSSSSPPARRTSTTLDGEKRNYRPRRQPNSMKIRDDESSERGEGFSRENNLWRSIGIENGTARRDDDIAGIEFLRVSPSDGEDDEAAAAAAAEENADERAISRLEDSLKRLNSGAETARGSYTEGGPIRPIDLDYVIDQELADGDFEEDLNALLWSRDLAGFQRPERLDVKKPGPLYSTNNYAFERRSPPAPNDDEATGAAPEGGGGGGGGGGGEAERALARAPLVKKGTTEVKYNGITYKNVDLDYVWVKFADEFKKWSEGKKVVEEIGKLLEMSPEAFTDIRVGRAEVTFKVLSDFPDAIAVAGAIESVRDQLKKSTGKEAVRAGIGDKVKLPPSWEIRVTREPMSPGVFGVIVAAGGAAVAAAAVVTLVIARKHAKSRAKLAGLATPDPEASKDYQELCRARMQAKQPSDKPESPRIVGLSRESESQRSSTSSWGEEAAALSNMDISTGRMVLSYMEDHLRNKDRLDQEWAGIRAYEAEPASVARAMEKVNADRNRPGSALPYDHSRVVLNHLANANNSDYINASMITDHDPRNPAYIASQGPLPETAADFWQLVWEQGSVVIVVLTRLTEEGRPVCHRYWPEEGSELYHIYEVHLVSEHIWCDDYLVRSFYLKNLRTGETRTVTQFHFLSWPEHGVPHSTKALLEFRRKLNKSYRGRSCPIVVHCSDGAGRTGTYCLIDMVLNRMAKGAKEIDIAAALEHIRDQRPGMVATKQQFEFVLVAVAEEVHAILKAMPATPATPAIPLAQSSADKSTPPSAHHPRSSPPAASEQ